MNTPQKKPTTKLYSNDPLVEQLRDVGRNVAKTVKTDLISGMANDALSSLFGTPKKADMQPGQPVNLGAAPSADNFPPPSFERFMPRMRRPDVYTSPISEATMARLRQQEAQVAQKIVEIRQELKALMLAVKSVDQEIAQVINEDIVDPGEYHLNFLDRIRRILVYLRKNLSESTSWLSVMRSRKKQRSYWSMYKKKGTEFGLNPDRVVSTQVG